MRVSLARNLCIGLKYPMCDTDWPVASVSSPGAILSDWGLLMNQDQQPRLWWKDNRLAWALATLTSTSLVIISIVRGIITNPLLIAFAAFILATVFVVSLTLSSYGYGGNFLENILVEAHGMLLDILVIGIFILWLNRSGEKLLEVRRYLEEIDDFRGWDSDEAGYRIAGNVKRLNRNGITNVQLEECHLVKVNLSSTNLRCNRHYSIFRTMSDELMACLNISWQWCSVKPCCASKGPWGSTEPHQASLQAS
jgi:hypothetical protein